jgi:hypothetical protein
VPGGDLLAQHQLRERGLAGLQQFAVEQRERGHGVARAQVRMHRGARAQRLGLAGPQAQFDVDAVGGQRDRGRADPLAAMHLVLGHARERERAALARLRELGLPVLRMDAAHPHRAVAGRDAQFVAHAHLAAEGGAGHHRADAREREGAVDREAEGQAGLARAFVARHGHEPRAQGLDALARDGRDREHRRARERRRRQQRLDLGAHLGQPRRALRGVDAVDLGDRHRGAAHAEQRHHREVLARLRHHAIVGRHHQQRMLDAGGAGQHGVQQALVARHVDEAQRHALGRVQVGIAELDRDAAALLLGQPVGVDAGQRAHQRGLAVVDVACGSDDHGASIT